MRSDLPVFEKCCFCIPLRWGLLTWGYFKLIIASLLLGYYIFLLHFVINLFVQHKETVLIKNIVVFSVVLSTLIIDIVIHSLFIIGSHKKHVMYLKVYYFYALTLLVVTILLGIVSVDLMIQNVVNHRTEHLGKLYVMKTSALFINLTIQAYVILLVRSEIVKLKKLESFRCLNNAAEGQSTLQCRDPFIKNGRPINNADTNMAQFSID